MAANVRKAPYKDFLQPALQRRFSSTALVLLVAAYLEAVLLASWNSLIWAWFPLGPAGFRTMWIFSCGLALLILRIANYHVGLRTSGPGWQTLRSCLSSLQTYETAFWYGVSSFVFCPVFLFSTDDDAKLRFITYYSGDRARLNERPIFLACYLATCAIVQTVSHYRYDVDRLPLKLPKIQQENDKEKDASASPTPFNTVLQKIPADLVACISQAVLTLPIAMFLYFALFRSFAWGWALMVFRPFFNLPKSGLLPNSWPIDIPLFARCIHAGALLVFIWTSGNTAFSVFMAQAPLKNGKPLTFESKDPNGSLLNGLKSQKPAIKTFAMWELSQVAEESAVRRAAIYQDIDRKDGPMWSQVYAICMDVIKTMEARVDNYGKPAAPPPTAPPVDEPKQRFTAPLRDDPIFNTKSGPKSFRDDLGKTIGQITNSPGSSPLSKLSPIAKKKWTETTDRFKGGEKTSQQLQGQFGQWALSMMENDVIGALFRHKFSNEFAAAVLGEPYAETALYIHAILALTWLAVNSLAEDEFGNVHRDVPSIIRTLTSVIKKTEALKHKFPIHWTDPKGVRRCPEVDTVLDAARVGLERVVAKFEPYSTDLRLSLTDLRLAKEASTKPVEEVPQPASRPAVEAAPKPEKVPSRIAGERRTQRTSRASDRVDRQEMVQVR
jgi:nucleoporin NDC1